MSYYFILIINFVYFPCLLPRVFCVNVWNCFLNLNLSYRRWLCLYLGLSGDMNKDFNSSRIRTEWSQSASSSTILFKNTLNWPFLRSIARHHQPRWTVCRVTERPAVAASSAWQAPSAPGSGCRWSSVSPPPPVPYGPARPTVHPISHTTTVNRVKHKYSNAVGFVQWKQFFGTLVNFAKKNIKLLK